MSGRTYSITEPHPTVPSSHYMYSGRGGAGNISRVNPQTLTSPSTATGPASLAKLPAAAASPYVYAGRGGLGNIHRHKERAIFSFDEELAAQRRLQERAAPVYHVGRGGAGNFVDEPTAAERKGSAASTHSGSSGEGSSPRGRNSAERVWDKVTRSLSRQ